MTMKLVKKISILLAFAMLLSCVSVVFTACGEDADVIEVDQDKTQI